MNLSITFAVARRVLLQLRRDPRTIALLLVVPCVLLVLLWWMFDADEAIFNLLGPPLLAMFPFIVMFLVTSVTTLAGALLRHPGAAAVDADGASSTCWSATRSRSELSAFVQSLLAVGLTVGLLGLDLQARCGRWRLVAVFDAVLGTTMGLFVSAFAETEFQAVQFMPALRAPAGPALRAVRCARRPAPGA